MTQFQSNAKNSRAKDLQGNRTLFDCQKFRMPQAITTADAADDIQVTSEIIETTSTRKRPMVPEQVSATAKR